MPRGDTHTGRGRGVDGDVVPVERHRQSLSGRLEQGLLARPDLGEGTRTGIGGRLEGRGDLGVFARMKCRRNVSHYVEGSDPFEVETDRLVGEREADEGCHAPHARHGEVDVHAHRVRAPVGSAAACAVLVADDDVLGRLPADGGQLASQEGSAGDEEATGLFVARRGRAAALLGAQSVEVARPAVSWADGPHDEGGRTFAVHERIVGGAGVRAGWAAVVGALG